METGGITRYPPWADNPKQQELETRTARQQLERQLTGKKFAFHLYSLGFILEHKKFHTMPGGAVLVSVS